MREARCRSPVTLQRDLKRAQIVLLAVALGQSPRKLGSSLGLSAFGGIAMRRLALKGFPGRLDEQRWPCRTRLCP